MLEVWTVRGGHRRQELLHRLGLPDARSASVRSGWGGHTARRRQHDVELRARVKSVRKRAAEAVEQAKAALDANQNRIRRAEAALERARARADRDQAGAARLVNRTQPNIIHPSSTVTSPTWPSVFPPFGSRPRQQPLISPRPRSALPAPMTGLQPADPETPNTGGWRKKPARGCAGPAKPSRSTAPSWHELMRRVAATGASRRSRPTPPGQRALALVDQAGVRTHRGP